MSATTIALHVSADEIDRGRAAAFVRDVPDLYARQHVEHFSGHMGCPTGAGGCKGELIRTGFGKSDQLLHGAGGHAGMQHEHVRLDSEGCNRREIPDRIVRCLHHIGQNGMRGGGEQNRVTVGRRLRDDRVPIVVLPPPRLSTTTFCRQREVKCSPRIRPVTVVLPPGAYGVTIRIGRFG